MNSWIQFRLLLGIHFRVLKRQATATPGRRVVSILLVTLGGVASILLGLTVLASMWVGRHRVGLDPRLLDEAVHLGFAAVFVALVLSPALGFRGSDFLDVTRLFHLPVSHRTVFAASTVGISSSGGVLFWLPPLAGLLAGYQLPVRGDVWTRVDWSSMDWGLLSVRMFLVLLFLLHAVAVGQLLVLLLLDVLRSRRFRDLTMAMAPVVAGAVYFGAWWALTRGRSDLGPRSGAMHHLLGLGLSDRFPFLPSRWLTEAIVGSEAGGAGAWLPFLVGFLPLTLLVYFVGSRLQERAFLGDVPPPDLERGGSGRRIPGGAFLARLFPDPVLAIASKELRLLRREPIVKTVLLGQAVFLLLPVVMMALRPREEDAVGTVARISWAIPFLLVFVENTLTLNLLGLEGAGMGHLRTTPASWREILLGKNLCYLLLFGIVNAVLSAGALGAMALLRPEKVPDPGNAILVAAVGGAAALAVVMAVGNVLSVSLPTPLTVRGRMALRQQGSFSEGCYEKLARVAVFAGTLVLVVPIPLALHVLPANAGGIFQEAWWPPLAAALSVAYAAALLRISLPMAEEMARAGEDAILRRLTRSGE